MDRLTIISLLICSQLSFQIVRRTVREVICQVRAKTELAASIGLLTRVDPFAVDIDRLTQVVDLGAEILVADCADHSAHVSIAIQLDFATVLVIAETAARVGQWRENEE